MGYVIIIDMDFFRELRVDILNSTSSIKWDEVKISMRPRDLKMDGFYII